MSRKIVTSALPYANGKLHIGHVAGAYLPADIFVRFLRLQDEDVIYICGTDEHGSPISIKAEAEGVTPQDIVDRYHKSIEDSFIGLSIDFDNFSGTARPDHYKLSQQFFTDLLFNRYIITKKTTQFYCEKDRRFLADRYVEGICPHCGADGARGDQCDTCGKLIDTVTLKEPKCKICGNKPILKDTEHWFLDLPKFTEPLKKWLETKTDWKENVLNFSLGMLKDELIQRAITRDIDWGVPVPLPHTEGKVLYVWFDAPIGYISSTIEWAKRKGNPDLWKEYWLDPETKMYHFIGKDNITFHTIIWPAMLMGQKTKYVLPYNVPANEYLNLEGNKISTSRNWAIWVEDYLKYFEGDYLRYVMAANAPENKDCDFAWKDFQLRVNSELNNVLGNLVNRVFTFCQKNFDGTIPSVSGTRDISKATLSDAKDILEEIKDSYATFQVRKVCRLVMDLARLGNKYFDETKPWVDIKEDREKAAETMFVCGELIRMISVVFYPIIPNSMKKLRRMMNIAELPEWYEVEMQNTEKIKLSDVAPLFRKIEDAEIEQQLNLLKANSAAEVKETKPIKAEIEYDDFAKLDLRIVKILEAEIVPKTDKLLHLKVDIGGETKELIAGIQQAYKPEAIIGKKVLMLVNLKPRTMRGITSQGMILCAVKEDGLALMTPDFDVPEGTPVS
ncbi:MAG TPA: methionine--tRNA ligase [Candidatus Cloacimonadota bacterium]|nr:methionine--tRNA ligase [Candidatus Cloacimonadota bacterium]HPT71548.1 methionine--tRNA ligase [Candidatus Cloacimonadota bacterium]